jgi:hypothetical protein
MNDTEFILFLWKLLIEDLTDGDVPSEEEFETVRQEFIKRGLEEEWEHSWAM